MDEPVDGEAGCAEVVLIAAVILIAIVMALCECMGDFLHGRFMEVKR